MAATYESIATVTLSSTATSVTFSSIPSSYTDLIMIISTKINSGTANLYLTLNSDTSSNYSNTFYYGNNNTNTSSRMSNQSDLYCGTAYSKFSSVILQFPNYSNSTTFKNVMSRYGQSDSGNQVTVSIFGLWRSTATISTIKLSCAQNLFADSTFCLYGIKAA